MTILGLDTASSVSGYGILQWWGESPLLLAYGVLKVRATQSHDQRLHNLSQQIKELCKMCKHPVTRFAVEQSHFRKNFQTAITLAKFVGVAQMMAWDCTGKPAHLITASEIRRMIHSKDKEDTKRIIEEKFEIDLSSHPLDVSDAIALAWTALTRERTGNV